MSRLTHSENADFGRAKHPGLSTPAVAIVEEPHDPDTGRLDTQRAARALGVPLGTLAKAIGSTPSALAKRSSAKSVQLGLREIEFAIAGLRELLGSDRRMLAWLNEPHPDLGGEPPINLLAKGSAREFANYVRSALAGQPT
jgi:Protein of unknown function (DUF2384)